MRKEISVILTILVLSIASIGSIGLVIYFSTSGVYTIRNIAIITSVEFEVTWDITGTKPCSEINWGTLTPGSNKNITLYIRNAGNRMTGSFNTSNWFPTNASNYITLTWNFGEAPLYPNRIRTTIFTLSISPSIQNITDFSFNILITGTLV